MLKKLFIPLTCVLLLLCIAMQKSNTIVLEGNSAKGFRGPVPVKIYVTAGKIDSIQVLPNQETPAYLSRAKQGILSKYKGKTLKEAQSLKVNAVSGATYSSRALITNIQTALK